MSISTFDCLGPIMVGPSSSHTAGAAKIGLIANKIANNNIKKVTFYLHGSFAKTYKGHGTDKALLGGILGLDEKNKKIKNSFSIAKKKGIKFEFLPKDLGEVHPNTVLIEILTNKENTIRIQGSSIGGGAIEINKLNGLNVSFNGSQPTIITNHKDVPGIVAKVTTILANENLNISNMGVFRNDENETATMIIELDSHFNEETKDDLLTHVKEIENIYLF